MEIYLTRSSRATNSKTTDITMATDDRCMHLEMGHSSMIMTFHWGHCEDLMFTGWQIRGVGSLIGSMIGVFFMAAIYESIKYYREHLWMKLNKVNQCKCESTSAEAGNSKEIIHNHPVKQPAMLSTSHALQTGLFVLQVVLAYLLMLVFMSYNSWLCIAVVAGAATGYLVFGWRRTVIADVTEHCH